MAVDRIHPLRLPGTEPGLLRTMTDVRSYTRIRNGEEEIVREHQRGDAGYSERSATNYKRVTDVSAVEAAKARLRAKGIEIA